MLKNSESNEQKRLEWEIFCSSEKYPASQTGRRNLRVFTKLSKAEFPLKRSFFNKIPSSGISIFFDKTIFCLAYVFNYSAVWIVGLFWDVILYLWKIKLKFYISSHLNFQTALCSWHWSLSRICWICFTSYKTNPNNTNNKNKQLQFQHQT